MQGAGTNSASKERQMRIHYMTLVVLMLIDAGSANAFSQEKKELSAKVDFRFGQRGPRRNPTVHPGEMVCFTAAIRGLTPDKEEKLNCTMQIEMRSTKGDLISVMQSAPFSYRPVIGRDGMLIFSGIGIPDNYSASDMELWINIVDVNSENEITEKLPLSVKTPEGIYPINVAYCLDARAKIPVSGRYVEGEEIHLVFCLAEAEQFEKANCSLAFIPANSKTETRTLETVVASAEGKKLSAKQMAHFTFIANAPFEGVVRLTIKDDGKHTNSVDIPLSISECLR
jgi:hypothetical protein